MLALDGLTAIETKLAFVTLSVAVPVWPAKLAETVVPPCAIPVAIPPLLEPFPTVAAAGFDEVQFDEEVRSKLVPSWNMPQAVNESWMLSGTFADSGVN